MILRKSLSEELRNVTRTLQIALAKLQMAIEFLGNKEKRRSFIMNVTLLTAVHGIPVTPDMMGGMYFNDALSDLKKASKRLRKLITKLKKKRVSLRLLNLLSTIEIKLNELDNITNDPIKLKEELNNIIMLLQEARTLVELEASTV